MFFIFSFIPLASLLISAAPSIPAPLQSLRSHFASAKGFEVEFTQQLKQDIFPNQDDRASGTVKFERPVHLIWNYLTPTKRRIEYTGKELSIFEDGEKQILQDPGKMGLQESFSFLWGETNSNVFKVVGTGASTFRIFPRKNAEAMFKFIDVTVKDGFVQKAVVTNPLEGESTLEFKNWKLLHK